VRPRPTKIKFPLRSLELAFHIATSTSVTWTTHIDRNDDVTALTSTVPKSTLLTAASSSSSSSSSSSIAHGIGGAGGSGSGGGGSGGSSDEESGADEAPAKRKGEAKAKSKTKAAAEKGVKGGSLLSKAMRLQRSDAKLLGDTLLQVLPPIEGVAKTLPLTELILEYLGPLAMSWSDFQTEIRALAAMVADESTRWRLDLELHRDDTEERYTGSTDRQMLAVFLQEASANASVSSCRSRQGVPMGGIKGAGAGGWKAKRSQVVMIVPFHTNGVRVITVSTSERDMFISNQPRNGLEFFFHQEPPNLDAISRQEQSKLRPRELESRRLWTLFGQLWARSRRLRVTTVFSGRRGHDIYASPPPRPLPAVRVQRLVLTGMQSPDSLVGHEHEPGLPRLLGGGLSPHGSSRWGDWRWPELDPAELADRFSTELWFRADVHLHHKHEPVPVWQEKEEEEEEEDARLSDRPSPDASLGKLGIVSILVNQR
jgi:hypothetical protein